MTPWEAAAIFAAGVGAGGINTIVGSGSLITFPTLLALGYPPVVANVSNNVGLVPGGVAGAFGYRAELKGQRARLIRLGIASVLGSVAGSLLLLRLPEEAFQVIVPVLIGIACVLVVLQPRINARLARLRRVQSAPAAKVEIRMKKRINLIMRHQPRGLNPAGDGSAQGQNQVGLKERSPS